MAPAPAFALAQMYIYNNILPKKAIDFVYRNTKNSYDGYCTDLPEMRGVLRA